MTITPARMRDLAERMEALAEEYFPDREYCTVNLELHYASPRELEAAMMFPGAQMRVVEHETIGRYVEVSTAVAVTARCKVSAFGRSKRDDDLGLGPVRDEEAL